MDATIFESKEFDERGNSSPIFFVELDDYRFMTFTREEAERIVSDWNARVVSVDTEKLGQAVDDLAIGLGMWIGAAWRAGTEVTAIQVTCYIESLLLLAKASGLDRERALRPHDRGKNLGCRSSVAAGRAATRCVARADEN